MDNMLLPRKRKNSDTMPIKPGAEIDNTNDAVPVPPLKVAVTSRIADGSMSSYNTLQTSTENATKWYRLEWLKRMSLKKKLTIFIPIGVLVIGGGAVGTWALTRKKPMPVVQKAVEPAPVLKAVEPAKPTTVAGKLSGVQITPELNQRGITGVMIENSIDARPQSGLLDAGVVFEAIAEGGITRFLALFQEGQPDYIGPVRSARPYYITWLKPFGATYAHVGGSPVALQMIQDHHIRDMNEFANSGAYQRVSSRFAPHNAYTSSAKLDQVKDAKKYDTPDFVGFVRKAEAPSKSPNAINIAMNLSSTYFNVHYDYDVSTNSYNRSEGGKPHTDERSRKQLSPKVVVALVVPYAIDPDGIHSAYQTIGTGKALVFQDGTYQEVTWTKTNMDEQIRFTDASGAQFGFNPGQMWITAIGQQSMLAYNGPAAAAAAP